MSYGARGNGIEVHDGQIIGDTIIINTYACDQDWEYMHHAPSLKIIMLSFFINTTVMYQVL